MPLRIESADGSHYAKLTQTVDGVRVEIWRATTDRWRGKRLDAWTVDCAWHVACDRTYATVRKMEREI